MLVPTIVLVSDSVAAFRDSVCFQFALFSFCNSYRIKNTQTRLKTEVLTVPDRKKTKCVSVLQFTRT